MSRVCQLCEKGKMRGNTVSHSNRKAPRHYKPNLQKISFVDSGNTFSVRACTKCKKTIEKRHQISHQAPVAPTTPTTPVATA